jgi:hypothetical protein
VTWQPAIKEAREAMAQQGCGGVAVAVVVDVDRVRARARARARARERAVVAVARAMGVARAVVVAVETTASKYKDDWSQIDIGIQETIIFMSRSSLLFHCLDS